MREDRTLMNCLEGLSTDDTPLTEAEFQRLSKAVLQRTVEQKKTGKSKARRRHWPIWGKILASGAACAVLLVGLNSVNPALAEGLPLLGDVFAYFNALPKGYLQSEQLSEYARPAQGEGSTADGAQSEENAPGADRQQAAAQPYTITLSQIYCDELYLRVGLVLTARDDSLASFDAVTLDPPLLDQDTTPAEANTLYGGVTLNGEPVGGDLVPCFRRQDAHTFVCEMDYNLQQYTGTTQDMQASLTFSHLVGVQEGSEEKTPLDGSYPLEFTVSADTTLTRVGNIEGDAENGIRPVSLQATPGETCLQYAASALPENVQPYPQMYTAEGKALEWVRATPEEQAENGETLWSCYFEAVPEGVTELRVQVVDKNSEQQTVLAEWTVSLPE